MISANRSNSKQGALDAGANDYLAKPFAIDDLLTRMEALLERR
jgi:DNA-binding response OmpR family regulator